MAVAQHVFKRGSMYWWRRRLPKGSGSDGMVLIEISLRTKHLGLAKLIAAEVTLASEYIIRDMRLSMFDPNDAKKIIISVAKKHSARLDHLVASKIAYVDSTTDNRRKDLVAGWTARLFAAQGLSAQVGENEEKDLAAAGVSPEIIAQIKERIGDYIALGIYPTPREKLVEVLVEFGLPENQMNLDIVQNLYLRGISAALLNMDRRWSGVRPDDISSLRSALEADAVDVPVQARNAYVTSSLLNQPKASDNPMSSSEECSRASDLLGDEDEEDEDDEAGSVRESERGLVEIIERLAGQKVKSDDWTEKTAKQHVALAKLFVRFVGHDNPAKMRQSHISDFKLTLSDMPKNYGKSPQDHVSPLVQILARAKDMPPEKVGLSQSTLNRHMTQMSNIVAICKHAGFPFGNFEGVSGLRSKKKGSGRGERARFTTDELRLIFNLPIWNGCEGVDARLSRGELLFHDASYWAPMLALYHGPRREEYCGLLVSEVEADAEIPAIRIEPNFVRGLKNPESKRRIPIHTELIRLGFLEYVAALKDIGHVLLFPELKAAAASTPMGDVFDEAWQDIRIAALPSAKEDGKVLHSLRHWCNNEMKQSEVAAEIRKDILGHTNADTNEGRYSDAARLRVMAKALAQLPQPTAHLSSFPIRLIERVEKHLAPPTKSKKSAS